MAKTKKVSPEETLRALYNLQVIDSKIDKMREVRGELPLEVEGLEDELTGLSGRVDKIQSDLEDFEKSISDKKNTIAEAKDAIKKYADQQNKVRNNREFDSLNKEVEYQDLEMQLAEKRIKEYKFKIESKQELLDEAKELFNQKKSALELKKEELKEIISETEKEEGILIQESEKAGKSVDDRYLRAYKRIRGASKNGLAVVPVERGASGGSFIKIPPQMQIDIAARKKIIVDEHSGRILVDAELATQQFDKINKKITRLLK
ncbi:MAG: hypothetical protein P8M12_04835 [Flavobacteriales bacterium]|jgi:uncharacterized protein|nr:hypothetical protein [Flavobacteriales bacterium]